MVSFDPETNCVEAFDISGYVDVFIDGAFYSRCEFLESVKVCLVLKPSKDVGTLDDKSHSLSNDLASTGDGHVGSEHSASCQRQGHLFATRVTGEDASSTFKEITNPSFSESSTDASITHAGLPDSNVVAKWDTIEDHQVSTALSENECEDINCDQEAVIEFVNDDGLSENGILPVIWKESNERSCTDVQNDIQLVDVKSESKQPHERVSGSKQHYCPICGKNFSSKEELITHRRNPSSRVSCVLCQDSFPSEVAYFIHFCRCHPTTEPKTQFGDYIRTNSPVTWSADWPTVNCPLCLKGLKEYNILRHLESCHFRDPSYVCCVCNITFCSGELWRRHCHSHKKNRKVGGSCSTTVTSATSIALSAEVNAPIVSRVRGESHNLEEEPSVVQKLQSEEDNSFTQSDTTFSSFSTVTFDSPTSVTCCNNNFNDGKSRQDSHSMDSRSSIILKDKKSHSLSLPPDHATTGRQLTVSREQSRSKFQDNARGHDGNNALCTPIFLFDDSDNGNETHLNVQGGDKNFKGATTLGQTQKSRKGKWDASHLCCEFCRKDFFNTRDKRAHRLNPYCEVKCVTCNSIYSSKGSLFKHYCRVHPSAQDLKEQFGYEFSFVNLKLFMDHKVCPLCMTPVNDKDCVKHFDVSHFTNQLFLCCVCGQDFSTEHSWNEHCHKDHGQQDTATGGDITHGKKKKGKYMTRRGECQKSVTAKIAKLSLTDERLHKLVIFSRNKDRNGQTMNEGGEHQCKYCKETFPSKLQLLSHPRRKTALKSECKQCGKVCGDQAELIIHEKKMHGSGLVYDAAGPFNSRSMIECPLCLIKVRRILVHVRKKHTNESLFVCCVCGKSCQSKPEYTRHCDALHTVREKSLLQCSVCDKTFDNRSDFNSHKTTHRKICRFCGENFLLHKHLEQHYLEKHDDILIPCNHCDRKFPSVSALKTHEKYIRCLPLQPCPKCGLMLRCVKKHMKTMHADVEPETQCNICGKKVKNRRLSIHMQHHKNEKVSCPVCLKVLKNKKSLNRHVKLVHFVEKMHECQICGKKCSMKSNLRIHMRIHSDNKMFPCKSCDQGFNYKASLLSHMRSKHPGVEPKHAL